MRKRIEEQIRISHNFYQRKVWLQVAQYIREKNNYCCQLCGKRGTYVHHIHPLTNWDYENLPAKKCYGEENLMLLCFNCHEKMHSVDKSIREGCYFDKEGNIQIKE